jgi:carbonic anhydrase
VVRNVANLVPPYAPSASYHGTSAALEFAVLSLGVEHIIVVGHARCGGIGALMRHPEGPAVGGEFIAPWIAIAAPARERALAAAAGGPPEAAQRACEHEAIKVSLANLMTFPWVRERVERGALALHGLYFDLPRGDLLRLESSSGAFRSVGVQRAGGGEGATAARTAWRRT